MMQHVLAYYVQPSVITSGGQFAARLDALPNDVDELVRSIQGLVVYENVAADFYGFTIRDECKHET